MSSLPPSPPAPAQARNPLHGVTLERLLNDLVAHFGWSGLSQQVPLRCFAQEPSIASSLKVLRKTPWAREQVESLYLFMLREQARQLREQRDQRCQRGQQAGGQPADKSPGVA